jgi:2-polyprenyl-3-methyl-5-hydroxy-6-metoxy-1,4-benzoquinol methylase
MPEPSAESALASSVEWGGPTWTHQVEIGLDWLGDLSGCRVLEIGARFGGMSILFGRLGADVVGIDMDDEALKDASRAAAGAGVSDHVRFEHRSGAPDDLPAGFDIVFFKSVLVVVPDQDAMLRSVAASLVEGGRLLLVENARGPAVIHAARMIRRGSLRPHAASYFTRSTVAIVRRHFDVQLERWTSMPPTVLIGATRR